MISIESAAEHEAAHVVTGVALGLVLVHATLRPTRDTWGHTQFRATVKHEAYAIMCAAGIAWERATGGDCRRARLDRKCILGFFDEDSIEAFVIAADAILRARPAAHARVTRLLLERDITRSDIDALARGETPDE